MKLVVGLGNPGRKYERTRHNVGFWVVDYIARQQGVAFRKKLCEALVVEWPRNGEKTFLAKPQTFMNRSGVSVKGLLRELHGSAEDMVVVYDDLDLPLGRIRVRSRGSAGGHRGMLSILECLAAANFFRVRVGIGRPPQGMDATEYVLHPFGPEERSQLDEVVTQAADAVVSLLEEGGARTMERFNRAT